MKLTIVMDGRFEWSNRKPYSGHMAYNPFVARFLTVFDEVTICARAYDISTPTGSVVTGPNANFVRIGDYRGAKSFLAQLPRMIATLWRLAGSQEPVLAYLPGTLAIIFGYLRLLRGRPLYSLVVADPADQLSAGALDHPLRRPVRRLFIISLKQLLKRSKAAMYVTRFYLQRHYPLGVDGVGFATSDVYLPDEAYTTTPRSPDAFTGSPKTLIYVAMMAQGYKGHDDLLRAFADARRSVPDLKLVLIGDGPLRPNFEALASELGILDKVEFAGKLPHGPKMIARLDEADLFVMPSRAEGLPRALVEAMARGLPALSTDVGGVGELLPAECLAPANNYPVFSLKISELIQNPSNLAALSAQNLETARFYCSENTASRMNAFYRHIREVSDNAP